MKKKVVFCVIVACFLLFGSQALATPNGALTVAVSSDIHGLDPVVMGYTINGQLMSRHVFDRLFWFNILGINFPHQFS